MDIPLITRSFDGEDLASLLDYVNAKGVKPIMGSGLTSALEAVVDDRTFNNQKMVLVEDEGVFEADDPDACCEEKPCRY